MFAYVHETEEAGLTTKEQSCSKVLGYDDSKFGHIL